MVAVVRGATADWPAPSVARGEGRQRRLPAFLLSLPPEAGSVAQAPTGRPAAGPGGAANVGMSPSSEGACPSSVPQGGLQGRGEKANSGSLSIGIGAADDAWPSLRQLRTMARWASNCRMPPAVWGSLSCRLGE